MSIRIPWRIKAAAYRVYQYARSLLSRMRPRRAIKPDISFYCNYQQTTGATVAIACIANNLCKYFNVDAHIKPLSGYTKLLSLCVRQYSSPSLLAGDIVFMDIQHESRTIANLEENNRPVILTCHAFPAILHDVPQDKLQRNLELSSFVHFVSEHQRSEFIQHYPRLNLGSKSFVISNYSRKCSKSSHTGSIGVVGLLNRAPKNALKAIQLGQQSNARTIECWGSDSIHGLDNPEEFTKLRVPGWSDNIHRIFNSFDVLVSTSQSETFALVVAEALSAGIPCLLSDIPVYRELYSDCEGVAIMTGDDQQDVLSINQLLAQADQLKPIITSYWEEHFSEETVTRAWIEKIRRISA